MGDKFERKHVIVSAAAGIVACGLIFSQVSVAVLLIAMGVGLTLASNIMSFSFHAYQAELFPTSIPLHGSRVCLFVEPLLSDLHFIPDRWRAQKLRDYRGVCADCGSHVGGDGDHRWHGAENTPSLSGRNFFTRLTNAL